MPSVLIGNPVASGPQPLISGNPWSGTHPLPTGVQLVAARENSGSVYIGFSGGASGALLAGSGGVTLTSGGMMLSGGGLMDGVQMAPGAAYFLPARAIFYISGTWSIFARHDAACSGQSRIFWEIF